MRYEIFLCVDVILHYNAKFSPLYVYLSNSKMLIAYFKNFISILKNTECIEILQIRFAQFREAVINTFVTLNFVC